MQRLSLLDALFLDVEEPQTPMHIAGICTFEGPAPSRDELRAHVREKLSQVPRYRQRMRRLPLELGRPVWVDDTHFDLDYHLKFTAVPSPGDDRVLRDLIGRVLSPTLDRTRPLWETWFVEGLTNGQWAMIAKTHHSMVDGVSGAALMSAMLDLSPDAPHGVAAVPEWHAESEPESSSLVRDAWRGLAEDATRWGGKLRSSLRTPRALRQSVKETFEGLYGWTQNLSARPQLSIGGTVGRQRAYGFHESSLSRLHAIRQARGGTINDVVLAVIAGGFRHYLMGRGDDVSDARLRTLVPVSVRRIDERDKLTNRVGALFCELPISEPDALERLRLVREQMQAQKTSHMAEAIDRLLDVGNMAPPMVVEPLARLITFIMRRRPQRALNTITTNVPGPQFPLYMLGRRQLRWLPYVPIHQGVRTGVAILSYDGKIYFGVTGDYDSTPDVQVLADAIGADLEALYAAAVQPSPPPGTGENADAAVPMRGK